MTKGERKAIAIAIKDIAHKSPGACSDESMETDGYDWKQRCREFETELRRLARDVEKGNT